MSALAETNANFTTQSLRDKNSAEVKLRFVQLPPKQKVILQPLESGGIQLSHDLFPKLLDFGLPQKNEREIGSSSLRGLSRHNRSIFAPILFPFKNLLLPPKP